MTLQERRFTGKRLSFVSFLLYFGSKRAILLLLLKTTYGGGVIRSVRYENYSAVYSLTAVSVDEIAGRMEVFLSELKIERLNALRIRLGIEEALLRWRDRFGEKAEVKFSCGVYRRRPSVTLELVGDPFDPFRDAEDDQGGWAGAMLTSVGFSPHYLYQQGVNIARIHLPRLQISPARRLLLSLSVGLFFGVLGALILSDAVRERASWAILDPIQNVFFRILNAAAGPVIFLSVLTSICGVGNIASSSRQIRRFTANFFLICTVNVLFVLWVTMAFFPLPFVGAQFGGESAVSLLKAISELVPNDLLTPLMTSDSPQLILLAFFLGSALLSAGQEAGTLVSIVEQAQSVGLIVADWVSRLSPFFISILLILGLWNGTGFQLLGIWKPLLLFFALTALTVAVSLLTVRARTHVGIRTLFSKVKESFLLAMRSASVDEAFGANQFCCEKRLGINRRFLSRRLSLGLIVYMPASVIATVVFTVYAANFYGVQSNIVWYILAVGLTVLLVSASPPLTGIGILTYTVIFARLGIPAEALTIALITETILGFVTAPVNQLMLQLNLVLAADRMQLLDRETLLSRVKQA